MGEITDVNAGFLRYSDINFNKIINNWKRMVDINGEYWLWVI